MNILFSTQGESLRLFNSLLGSLAGSLPVERAGFTVADSLFYDQWLQEEPGFEKQGHVILKEWEVTVFCDGKPNLAKLAHYEKMLGGQAGVFGAIVADRRLLMGPDCTYTQDYRRRFSDDQLLCILQQGLEQTERLFDELKPDVVVGFICVTMLDYLVYLFAKARGVRYFNLRPTRIGDRICLVSTLNDPSPELAESFARIQETAQSPHMDLAKSYLRRVREEHARYEGVVRPSDKPALRFDVKKLSRVDDLLKVAAQYRHYRSSAAASDNHVPDPARMRYFSWVRNPMLAKKVRKYLQPRYITAEQLGTIKYVFFPLHTEPEVSLLVYGRPYLNQTEIIRMLALSLPVDTVLVVKEHPWMVGKRSLDSYKKMLNIPRVRFADPRLEARVIIQNASLVAVVTGSVGLEAAMLGKPVITFGDCPFNLLPMVRRCEDPRKLQTTIREMMERAGDDEAALESYVSAVYETSESVSLYSVLLNKKNVHTEGRVTGYQEEVDKLGAFLQSLLAEKPTRPADGAAAW
jgi:hypothetical protein